MVSVKGLTFSYGQDPVLADVSFAVATNTIVGLAGPNGAGKTTIFQLIMKQLEPDFGAVETHGSITYVPQEVKHDPLLDTAGSVKNYLDADGKYRDYEIEQILKGLGLAEIELTRSPQDLSGGQKTKLALARALLLEPDILLLDEPTNFLDSRGKAWVMNFLSRYPHTVILISHDLDLLDKQISKVLFINPLTKQVETYKGNYSSYLVQKKERDAQLAKEITKQERQIESLEKGLKRMKFKSGKGVRRRIVQQRRIERLQVSLPELPPAARRIKVRLPEPAWIGHRVLEARHVAKAFGDKPVLADVTFELLKGERLALVGPNGVGKSTLIKIIMGKLESDGGEVNLNAAAKIGYYSQEFETFDLDKTLMQTVEAAGDFSTQEIRTLLGKFLFSGSKVEQTVRTLSGGEKTRLAIALLLLTDYNLLILDEPTTYLDPMSQRAILEALKEYAGAMIVVSHTEDFIKELEPKRALVLPDEQFTHWRDELLIRIVEI